MADEADNAQDHMERESAGSLARSLKPLGPTANGRCHWCDDLIADNLRWCPAPSDCRPQWDREQKALARSGVRK